MKILVYFMIAASLIGAGNFSLSVGSFQLSVYRSLLIVLFLTVILEDIKRKKISLHYGRSNHYSVVFITFWLIYALLSVTWVKDYSAWFKAVFFVGSGFMVMIVLLYYFRTKEDLLHAFWAFLPFIIFHNIVGWYEWITGRYLFLQGARVLTYQRVQYPVSTFGNTNDYGLFLLFSCFILFICLMNSRKKLLCFSYIAVILSSVVLVYLTKSRASLLGLLLGAGFLLLVSVRKKEFGRVFLSALLMLLFACVIKPDLITNVVSKVDTMLTFDFSQQAGSEFVRINLIKNGLVFLMSTIGFGTGAGNIEYWMEHYAVYDVVTVYNIHNWWLEVLVSFGIFIFTGYLVFYVKLMLSMWTRFRHSNDKVNVTMAIGILSIMVAYIIASISSSSVMNSEWLWVFWGMVIAYQGISDNETARRPGDVEIE